MTVLSSAVNYHISVFISVNDNKVVKKVVDTILEDPYFTKRKAGVLSVTTHPVEATTSDTKLLISLLLVLPNDITAAQSSKVLTPEQNQLVSTMLMHRLILESPTEIRGWKLTTFDSYETVNGIVDLLLAELAKPAEDAAPEAAEATADV